MLFKQHFIHNSQFLLLSTFAYIGVIFIVLSIAQVGNNFEPHRLNDFQGFLVIFVTVFGILYVGHSFPAFRSKEGTISYLMTPASTLEKFAFEFLSRIGFIIVALPVLFWVTFHLQGFIFAMFAVQIFEAVSIWHVVTIDDNVPTLVYYLVSGFIFLSLSLAFTGSAMFTKQPLVKTLFAVAVILMFFFGYAYIVIEHLGFGHYNPPENMMLVPADEQEVLRSMAVACFGATTVMLLVAFLKLKEREV
jgi:hypothetical protein